MELHQKQQSKEKQTNDERKRFEQQISITQKTLHQLMVYKRNKLVRKYKQHLPLRLVGNLLRFVMSPLPYCRMRRDTLEVRRSGLFNDAWYLSQYPDLYLTTVDMLQHYMLHGAQEGRNPNPYFDSHYYFNENPDVKEIGLNPLLHFLRYGCNEGRKPNQSFDPKYYLENNLDVKAANMNPLFHYSHYGVTEGRKTSENNLEGNVEDKVDQENFLFHKQNLRESKKTNLKIVVVFHVYHTDIIGECLEYIKNIPFEYDLIVTTSLPQDNEDLKKLRDVYPELRIVFCENKGRDIGAFIKAWQFIQAYDICCKVHTKKGDSSYIKLWRNLSLSEILGNSKLIEQIIFEFECDPNIAIAGAELLYGSYNSLIGKNKTNCEYLRDEYSIPSNNFSDNGFFMGTMFWMRVEKYSFISNFENLRFSEETGLNEGSYEHAIERLLGSFSLQKNDKIILTRLFQNNLHSYKVLSADYQPAIKTFHAHFDLLSDSKKFTDKITGYIDNNDEYDRSIVGWLAMIGDEKPREAVIRINDELDVDIICSKYRIDLDSEGINKGNHGFRFLLPFKYADGSLYNLVLVDKFSGKVVDSIFIKKKHLSVLGIDRENSNWDIKREHEFHEKLNKCKALKGNCFSGLVSIIMPTYNRADIIGNAIQSALNQVYVNFELIIVDDDSTDDTECVVKKLIEKDERIKYKKIIKGGVSKARNTGLSLSMGKYIFYLDSDNEWVENYLRTMVDFLYYTELDSAYCGLEAIDDNNRTKHFIGNDFSWDELKYANYIDINSFGHIKKCDDLILFDESLKRFVDWDYILNFTKNHTVSYVPFLGVKYYDGTRSRISNNVYQESQELVEIISQIQIKYECILRSVSYDRISTSCKLNITNAC